MFAELMQELGMKKLLQVVITLRDMQHTGILTIVSPDQKAVFYFSHGQLVDAQTEPPDDTDAEDVLYQVLNWQKGQLQWQAGPPTPNQNLDSQQASDFYQAVEDLANLGYFDQPQLEVNSEIATFLDEQVPDVAIAEPEVLAATNVTKPTLPPDVSYPLLSLPLLPGQPIEMAIPPASVPDLLAQLRQIAFTGYAIVDNLAEAVALLVCEKGRPTAVYISQPAFETYAEAAWGLLTQWDAIKTCTLVILESQPLVSWRAALGNHRPYTNLAATATTFQSLLATFKRGSNSGTIIVRLPDIRLFHLIYEGQALGTYRVNDSSNRLYPFSGDLATLLENPQTRLDVLISRPDTFIFSEGTAEIEAALDEENPYDF